MQPLLRLRATRDLKRPSKAALTPSALHQLAAAMQQLLAFHAGQGGQEADAPLLHRVEANPDSISAYITSGKDEYKLTFTGDAWVLSPTA